MEDTQKVNKFVNTLILDNQVLVFSATFCKYCKTVKDLFTRLDINFFVIEIDEHEDYKLIKDELFQRTNQTSVPNIFIHGIHMGGCSNIMSIYENGLLLDYVEGKYKNLQYDLIVIGGGSGGIAAVKEAALFKKKVALFDFVNPSPKGTKWGVGGTCVNVGCIPKILMHHAAILGEKIEDSTKFGWNIDTKSKTHNWTALIESIQNHIKKLNFNYLVYFRKNNIDYFNAFAVFKNIHTIEATDKNGKVTQYTAHRFILATGGRPHIPVFPGNNYPITSDDLFSLKTKPGTTLVIGGSYIALECAGFLNGLGISCSVMVRSVLLRSFDQQIAGMIESHMESLGIIFLKGFVPVEITSGSWEGIHPDLKYKVKMKNIGSEIREVKEDYYNLVFLATGRDPAVKGIGLDNIGITINYTSGKVIVDKYDKTSCHTVYAIGDIQDGCMELTPVAIKSGQLVVRRLFDKSWEMDYKLIPTTVFTPLEYGCCGLSEEEAIKAYGTDVECYHRQYQPYEWILAIKTNSRCYVKLICAKKSNLMVVGLHILGPNAGEITQGFALALKLKASKSDFDKLVGIHPTCAEVFTSLDISRSDHPDPSDSQKGC